MSKRTPGPWGLKKAVDIWVMAGPIHVATIPRAHDGDWSPANANLVAAAPDLLEALVNVLPVLEENARWHRDTQSNAGVTLRAFNAADIVKAAIARAKGEA